MCTGIIIDIEFQNYSGFGIVVENNSNKTYFI